MLRYTQKQHFMGWLCVIALLMGMGIAGVCLTDKSTHLAWALGTLHLMLVATMVMLVLLLRKALKTHFYSYASMALIGGILFEGVFAASVQGYFIYALWQPEMLSIEYVSEVFLKFPRRFSFVAIIVIAVMNAAVLFSNIVLMVHEGFRPKNALGAVHGGLYLLLTGGMYLLTDYLRDTFQQGADDFNNPVSAGIYVFLALTLLTSLCYFECAFLGFVCMELLSVKRVPKTDKDFIIIPGCQIRKDGTPTPLLKGRVDRAVRFAREQQQNGGTAPKLIPSGGQGKDEIISEAASMAAYLEQIGIPREDILPEDGSFSTEQNMRHSKTVAEAHSQGNMKYAFSTTNYHVFRSGICAAEANMDAEGMASETKWYFWPNGAIREYFALLKLNMPAHIKAVVLIALACAFIGMAVAFSYAV